MRSWARRLPLHLNLGQPGSSWMYILRNSCGDYSSYSPQDIRRLDVLFSARPDKQADPPHLCKQRCYLIRIVRHDDGVIAVGGADLHSAGGFELAGMVLVNVIRVLKHVAGEDGDDVGLPIDRPRGGQLANSGERG